LWDYTNRVEVDEAAYPQTGVFYLDLGTLHDEDARYLGDQIQHAVQQEFHTEVSVGLASGKFPAFVAAAGHAGKVTLVTRHQEGAFVAPYSAVLLPASKETARRLALLYIREIGQLAVLPREAVLSQFGREGKLLYALAQGLDGRPIKPRRMPQTETVAHYFDEPLVDRTRLDVVVHHLAEDLSLRLEARNAALHAVKVTVHQDREQARANDLYLLHPIAGSSSIARTIQQMLERIKLAKGVCGLEVCAAHLVPNIPKQLELFTHKPGQAQLIDLARVLTARHGSCFYEAAADECESLLPERRFRLLKVDAS
jgi:nucleotidyltransferase/DNA polymerase involved in DNA repair